MTQTVDDRLTRLAALFTKLRDAQLNKDEENAVRYMEQVPKLLEGLDQVEHHKIWSRYIYELARIEANACRFDRSAELFLESGAVALKAGDELRHWIGVYHSAMTIYYGGNSSAKDTFDHVVNLYFKLDQLDAVHRADVGLRHNFEYNSLRTIVNLAFDCGDDSFPVWVQKTKNHVSVQSARQSPQPSLQLFDLQHQTRLHMTQGEFIKAASLFASYLDIETKILPLGLELQEYTAVKEFVLTFDLVMSRDYRDFVRSLSQSGLKDWQAAAAAAGRVGLSLDPGHYNIMFIEEIRSDIAKLDL